MKNLLSHVQVKHDSHPLLDLLVSLMVLQARCTVHAQDREVIFLQELFPTFWTTGRKRSIWGKSIQTYWKCSVLKNWPLCCDENWAPCFSLLGSFCAVTLSHNSAMIRTSSCVLFPSFIDICQYDNLALPLNSSKICNSLDSTTNQLSVWTKWWED